MINDNLAARIVTRKYLKFSSSVGGGVPIGEVVGKTIKIPINNKIKEFFSHLPPAR